MPSGTGHGHDFHHQPPFSDDSSLFSLPNPQYPQHIKHMFPQFQQQQVVYEAQVDDSAFCSLNFKLGLNENSNSHSTVVGGGGLSQCEDFGDLGLRRDVPEARPSSLIMNFMPTSWPHSQPIKERFWKPLNRCEEEQSDGKCYRSVPQEEERHGNVISLEEKYRLFSELEAIYALPSVPNQAGSALTGEIATATATDAPAGDNAARIGSEASIGVEETGSVRDKIDVVKRKRKKKKEELGVVVGFFERLVKQVMEHQEGLHCKFLEAIERMDRGRVEREEVWRRQEAEKRNGEAVKRAQEHALASSREAMVVHYIEKITGETVDLPDRSKSVDTNVRWPKAEVEALVGARGALEVKFQETGPKGSLWEEVSSAMGEMGYHRSAKRCKEKWDNINKYFRKKKDSVVVSTNSKAKKKKKRNGSDQQSKTCSYFDQLDQLYARTGHGVNNDDSCLDEAQQRGGYSELLAYIVAQNPNTSSACEMEESSKSDCEANVDEKVENDSDGEEEEEEVEHGNA